jgi:hypothetical protein
LRSPQKEITQLGAAYDGNLGGDGKRFDALKVTPETRFTGVAAKLRRRTVTSSETLARAKHLDNPRTIQWAAFIDNIRRREPINTGKDVCIVEIAFVARAAPSAEPERAVKAIAEILLRETTAGRS